MSHQVILAPGESRSLRLTHFALALTKQMQKLGHCLWDSVAKFGKLLRE